MTAEIHAIHRRINIGGQKHISMRMMQKPVNLISGAIQTPMALVFKLGVARSELPPWIRLLIAG
jgi:hypothetical protein